MKIQNLENLVRSITKLIETVLLKSESSGNSWQKKVIYNLGLASAGFIAFKAGNLLVDNLIQWFKSSEFV